MRVIFRPLTSAPAVRVTVAVSFLLFTMGVGTSVFYFHGWSLVDSIYMVVITIFSVGYEEVHPIDSPAMKEFVIVLIMVGCTTIIYITGGIVQLFTRGEISKILGGRRMSREIEGLNRHVIICGFGRVGSLLAHDLAVSKVPILVIDSSPEKVELAERSGCLVIRGNATDDDILRSAGVERAAYLATVLPADSINVFVTLSASAINPQLKIIARGEDPATEQKLLRAGAWKVVMPTNVGALKMSSFITSPSANEFLQLQGARQNIVEDLESLGLALRDILVDSGSRWVGRSIREIEHLRDNAIIVLALKRSDGEVINNPQNESLVEQGDSLLYVSRGYEKINSGGSLRDEQPEKGSEPF